PSPIAGGAIFGAPAVPPLFPNNLMFVAIFDSLSRTCSLTSLTSCEDHKKSGRKCQWLTSTADFKANRQGANKVDAIAFHNFCKNFSYFL
ncbi:MAG TPA: hypothetical protein VJZ91_19555, partial [Blastocatellia bacterium]|nr:hypothetical protein [Blastocatellia bacterium]